VAYPVKSTLFVEPIFSQVGGLTFDNQIYSSFVFEVAELAAGTR